MHIFHAIEQRRSVKHFDPNFKMPPEDERRLLELALLSPTSFNIQNWRFVVVRDPALKKQVRVGGVIVIPVGPQDGVQKLLRLERTEEGFTEKTLADVRFVPLIPGKAARL